MKNYIIIILSLLVFSSCEKFLSVRPKAEIVEDAYFGTSEGFEDAIYGVYATLGSSELYGENLSWGLMDVFGQYYRKAQVNDAVKALLSIDHPNLRGTYNSIWNKSYESIGYVNNILKNLKLKDEGSMKYYKLYKGEALGLRAFLHFDLIRLFGSRVQTNPTSQGIPYVSIYEPFVTPFSTVAEVYDLVIKDLKDAEQLLQEDENLMVYPRKFILNDGFATGRELHFNLYAAQALLARVYWMKGDLDNAAVYAKKVIDSGKFPLEDKVNIRNFLAGVISPKEAVWGIYSTKPLSGIQKYFYMYEPTFTWLPANDIGGLYTVAQEEGNDTRGNNWFRNLTGESESDQVVRCMKIVNEAKIKDPSKYVATAKEGINLIRIPELYLIMAEALLTKDPSQAKTYFDIFIEARGMFKLSSRPGNPALTLENILKERRKEFVQEGQYFFTLKKQYSDIYVDVLKTTLPASDKLYKAIIPDDEFEFRDN